MLSFRIKSTIKCILLWVLLLGCSKFKREKNHTMQSNRIEMGGGTSPKRRRIDYQEGSKKRTIDPSKDFCINECSDDVLSLIMSYLRLQEGFKLYHLNLHLINHNVFDSYLKSVFASDNFSKYFLLMRNGNPLNIAFHYFLSEDSLKNRKTLTKEKRNPDLFSVTNKIRSLLDEKEGYLEYYYELLLGELGIDLYLGGFGLHFENLVNLESHRYFLDWALEKGEKKETNICQYGRMLCKHFNQPSTDSLGTIWTGYSGDEFSIGNYSCLLTLRPRHKTNNNRNSGIFEFPDDVINSKHPMHVLLSMRKMDLDERQLLGYLNKIPEVDHSLPEGIGLSDLVFSCLCFGCVTRSDLSFDLEKILKVLLKFYKLEKLGKIDPDTWKYFLNNIAQRIIFLDSGGVSFHLDTGDQEMHELIRSILTGDAITTYFIKAMAKYFTVDYEGLYSDPSYSDFQSLEQDLASDALFEDQESFPIRKFLQILNVALRSSVSKN